MLLTILGIFLIVLAVVWLERMWHYEAILIGIMFAGILAIVIGLFVPINGYEGYELKKTVNLLPISGTSIEFKEEREIYAVDSDQGMYFVCAERPEQGVLKQKENYRESDTEITYSDEFVLKQYEAKAKKSIWGFAFLNWYTKYEICVPEDSVLKVIY